jgi:hypothetical protein
VSDAAGNIDARQDASVAATSATSGPFLLAEYDRAGERAWFDAADALLTAYSPWLAQVDRVKSEHARPTTVSVSGSPEIMFETTQTEASGELPIPEIVAGDMTSIVDAIDAQAQSEAAALEAMLLEHYRSITEAAGNVIDSGGEPLTHELILELVEKMELDFDEAGEPQFDFVITNRGMQAFATLEPRTPEQDAAWSAMIERKRLVWAERRRRRLTAAPDPVIAASESTPASADPPFAASEYNRVSARIIYAYLDARSSDFAPSLKFFPRVESDVARPSTVQGETGEAVTIDPIRLRTAVIPDYAAIVTGSRATLQATLDDLARSRAQRLVAFWEANAERAPGAGGIYPGLQPLTWDRLMDLMEGAAIGFDDDGNPTMRLAVGSAVPSLGPQTPDQAQRFSALLDRKREEYRARRRRRLMA